jgi:long-chain fatty acid transport protein
MPLSKKIKAASMGAALMGCIVTGQAQATEGYFQHGFGVRSAAVGGAGVADPADAMAIATNPAGLVDVGRQFNADVTLFSPWREYTGTATGFAAPGTIESSSNIFAIPSIGYSHPLGPDSAIGFAMYGNGGMNTTYKNVTNLGPACFGAPGVFCAGNTGVDFVQAFITAGYAHRFGNLSLGVAPIFAVQAFEAKGLGAFAGVSSDPANLTNRDHDISTGVGGRVGMQYDVTSNLRVGASYQTRIWMSKFSKYAGLFENGGDFDIPDNVTAGIAIDMMPELTLMFDYKRIFYSSVDAVSNSSTIPLPFGASGGPGFGWHDVDIFKVGIEWQQNPQWTWRLGYAYNDNPIEPSDVTLNILAPGVIQHHITSGFSYAYNDNNSIDFAAMFAPEISISGPEVTPGGPVPGSNIELSMYQLAFTLGWSHRW